ncbi:MAG: hypothetical protein V3R81_12310 [Gammaproteobacteria bacterium]
MNDPAQLQKLESIVQAIRAIPGGGGGGAVNSVTGGTGITDSGTAADPILDHDAHTGDVTGSTALTIGNDIVSNAKASDMPANTVKVNATGALADPQDLAVGTNSILGRLAGAIAVLTGTQVTTLLDAFTSTLKGLVPPSGGGTTNFLRADGTFAAPAGGGAVNSVTGGTNITNSGTAADPVLDHDAHTGDVTGATALTIPSNTVTYAKMQNIVADNTLLGNNSGPNQDPQELSATQARTLLNVEDGATAEVDATTTVKGIVELATDGESISNVVVQGNDGRLSDARTPSSHASTHTDGTDDVADLVGDSGSGGTHGLVPAPAAGDAAANKFLKADASWAIPAGGGGAHASTHEDGGGDEISVTNLSGLLADPQTPAPHPFILEHTFDSSTAMANPGAGDIRYNNAVPASVTQMAISKTSNSGVDIGLALSNAKNGDTVYFAVIDDSTKYMAFLVSSILSQPNHYEYFGSVVDSGTLPAASDILVMSIEQFSVPVINPVLVETAVQSAAFNSASPTNVPALTHTMTEAGDVLVHVLINIEPDSNAVLVLYVGVNGTEVTNSQVIKTGADNKKSVEDFIDLTYPLSGLVASDVITAMLDTGGDDSDLNTRRLHIR